MNGSPAQFPFVEMNPAAGAISRMPQLPLTLSLGQVNIQVSGLLDTGATINVLPYSIGMQLGANWDLQTTSVQLTGNLAHADSRVLVVNATVASFAPVRLAFAWTKSDKVPILLGQTNFFQEFDVCFFRSRSIFEIRLKS
jgi:hypothetical protein